MRNSIRFLALIIIVLLSSSVTINSVPKNSPSIIDSSAVNLSQKKNDSISHYLGRLDQLAKKIESHENKVNAMNQWDIDGKNNLLIIGIQLLVVLIIISIAFLYFKSQYKILSYRKIKMNDDSNPLSEINIELQLIKREVSHLSERVKYLEEELTRMSQKAPLPNSEELVRIIPESVKTEVSILFSATPEPDGYFVEKNLKSVKENVSLYKITQESPDSNQGIIDLVLDNPDAVKRAISAASYYLAPACDYYLDIKKVATGITQKSAGIVEKTDKGWKVTDKIKIHFEGK